MTTIEWLWEQYNNECDCGGDVEYTLAEKLFEQAKEMEKQQIIKAVYESMGTNLDPNIGRAEQYYNETYKNTKE
tara:strand:+ start:212 stop:433 length:222 start_codon:yes stop_codon:yes gene_type:complete